MANDPSRRTFLRSAPLAAAATLSLTDTLFAAAQTSDMPVPFQFFTAKSLEDSAKSLQAAPGNKTLVENKEIPVTVVMTTEVAKSAKEFEWHEGRDHLIQVLDGETLYQVGGTPKGAHNTKPGEWLAPDSEAATTYTLKKGDMLLIPRGTPHKRSTAGSVTFILISTNGRP
jgi:quercetin dioxygenase-like cupin family protein